MLISVAGLDDILTLDPHPLVRPRHAVPSDGFSVLAAAG